MSESTDPQRMTSVPILFEDEHLVAVAKPAGLFVHRSSADRTVELVLLQMVRDQIGLNLFTVHRLDRATSGLVVFAKSAAVAAAMGQLFADRRIQKTYQAVVRGFPDDQGQIQIPLVSARGRGKPEGHPHAAPQDALTKFETVQRFELPIASRHFPTTRCALVNVFPRTGRYHQIRRHFNYISHPVIGDTSHGDRRINRSVAEFCGLGRLMLAATRLQWIHPVTKQPLDLHCPPEPSFERAIRQLRLYNWPANKPTFPPSRSTNRLP